MLLSTWKPKYLNNGLVVGKFTGVYTVDTEEQDGSCYAIFVVEGQDNVKNEIQLKLPDLAVSGLTETLELFAQKLGYTTNTFNLDKFDQIIEQNEGSNFYFKMKQKATTKDWVIDLKSLQKVESNNVITPPIYSKGRKTEFIQWNGHYFRSPQELAVAKELDTRQILFFPNAGCRVVENGEQRTREVDFLICVDGNLGILECDSYTYHTSAAEDHKRDEVFNRHGIWFIRRFTSEDCKNPKLVADTFLELMNKFYAKKFK